MNGEQVHVPVDSKRQSDSAEGISGRVSESLYLIFCRSHFSESDLPPTDDEDETLDTKSSPFSPEKDPLFRFRSFSWSANSSSPRKNKATEETENLLREENRVDERRNKEELHIPGTARRRTPDSLNLNPIKSPAIVLDLSSSDEDDEVFEAEPVYFPSGERQGRFEEKACQPVSLSPRSGSPVLNNSALGPSCKLKNEPEKLKTNDVPGVEENLENMLQVPAVPRRARTKSSDEPIRENLHPKLAKRRSSESDVSLGNETVRNHTSHGRTRAGSCHISSSCGDYFIRRSRGKLTENASKLSEEEIHSLELDIFKPIDFYEILFQRMQVKGAKTAT